MSMKKADLEKHKAKKLDGRMKTGSVPDRFGRGAKAAAESADGKAKDQVTRSVSVTCRLPADLLGQLRERAVGFEGGMSALLTQAAEQWLARGSATER